MPLVSYPSDFDTVCITAGRWRTFSTCRVATLGDVSAGTDEVSIGVSTRHARVRAPQVSRVERNKSPGQLTSLRQAIPYDEGTCPRRFREFAFSISPPTSPDRARP